MTIRLVYKHEHCFCPTDGGLVEYDAERVESSAYVLPVLRCAFTNNQLLLISIDGKDVFRHE